MPVDSRNSCDSLRVLTFPLAHGNTHCMRQGVRGQVEKTISKPPTSAVEML